MAVLVTLTLKKLVIVWLKKNLYITSKHFLYQLKNLKKKSKIDLFAFYKKIVIDQ